MPPTITRLHEVVAALDGPDRARFDRLYETVRATARICPPPAMEAWIARTALKSVAWSVTRLRTWTMGWVRTASSTASGVGPR